MTKPTILIWGIGPTYRKRVIHNIQKSIGTGYDTLMDYIILTDYPDDFVGLEMEVDKRILTVLDIRELRKDYPWSVVEEMVPNGKDQEEYGRNYVAGMQAGRMFSYSIHRFSLIQAAEAHITKFILQDNDVDIRYDKIVSGLIKEEDFWTEFNTPVNSMKGCHKETVILDNSGAIQEAMAIGHNSNDVFKISRIVFTHLNNLYGTDKKHSENIFDITEGPFRYYNFGSAYDVKRYFEVWNEILRISYTTPAIRSNMGCGGYMLCDFIPVGLANSYNEISVLNFPNDYFTTNIYFSDRYFMPRGTGFAEGLCLWPAPTVEAFLELNKAPIDWLKNRNQWID